MVITSQNRRRCAHCGNKTTKACEIALNDVTAFSWAWDVLLKISKVNLEITEILFVERGIREGLWICAHRSVLLLINNYVMQYLFMVKQKRN